MHKVRATLLLLIFLAGCAEQPPFPPTGPLSESQLDWYVSKATNWFQTDEPYRGWPGRAKFVTIDRSRPIKKWLLPPGDGCVEIDIPNRGPGGHSYAMVF